jgi:viroplasmin and RNaseH domain-containing protein
MSDLIHIVYVSFSKKSLSEEEILKLLTEVRAKNKAQDVTGLLLYNNEAFIQVIEGQKNTINKLFEIIKKDTRHENVVKLLEEPVESRAFPDWSMGFQKITQKETSEIRGFSDFMLTDNPEEKIQNTTTDVIYLLNKFRKHS